MHVIETLTDSANCRLCIGATHRDSDQPRHGVGAYLDFGFGGNSVVPAPHVPWFVLPSTFGPMTPPGAPFSPYSSGTSTQSPDNPPAGTATFDTHSNVVRHWRADPVTQLATPRFVIAVPKTVPMDATGGPDTSTTIQNSFPGLAATGAAANYRWKDWIFDVQNAFLKYSNINTAMISFAYDGVVFENDGYAMSDGGAAANIGPFIWGTDVGGPTGNGINEIILTDQLIGGIGLTSMLVDPTNGEIAECDIIFEVGSTTANPPPVPGRGRGLIQNYTPAGGGQVTTLPTEWTALDHEIGHFYGLDHTNLHPGFASPQAAAYGVLPVPTYQPLNITSPGAAIPANTPTRAIYSATVPIIANTPTFPAMCGFITHMGVGVDMTTLQIHRDEYVGLSLLYPVPMPRPGSGRVPLINVSGSIRGRIQNNGSGVFGRNVWALPAPNLDSINLANLGAPTLGVVSSTARLTNDALTLAVRPWNPIRQLYSDDAAGDAPFFPVATPPSPPLLSVLGAGGTGDFAIDGLPVTVPSGPSSQILPAIDPPEFDIVFEDSRDLGVYITNPVRNQAEWFTQPGVYGGNPLAGLVTWRPAMTFVANGPAFALTGTGSLSLVPGTIIYLNPRDTDEGYLGSPTFVTMGGATVNPSAAPGSTQPPPRFRERAVRPLVYVTPRNGRSASQYVDVTVRLDESFAALDTSRVEFFIDGMPGISGGPYLQGSPGVIPGPATAQWKIPMASIIGGAAATTPVRFSVVIAARPLPGQLLIFDPASTESITPAIGRNDVIL